PRSGLPARVRGRAGHDPRARGNGTGRRARLALDQAPDARSLRALVQRVQPVDDPRVVAGRALRLADVIEPGRAVETLDPQLRVLEIAQQRPVAGAVAAPDTAALGTGGEKRQHVRFADPVLDRHHDGTAARLD